MPETWRGVVQDPPLKEFVNFRQKSNPPPPRLTLLTPFGIPRSTLPPKKLFPVVMTLTLKDTVPFEKL